MKSSLTRRAFIEKSALAGTLAIVPRSMAGFPFPLSDTIYTFDGTPYRQLSLANSDNVEEIWDAFHVFSALQGLVNRDRPRLYLFYVVENGFGGAPENNTNADQFWFDWMQDTANWPHSNQVQSLNSVEDAVVKFRDYFRGLVVYDPAVPATSNVASTIAGCDDLLPVRYDETSGSMYMLLTKQLRIPVFRWLVNPDGSSKFTGTGYIPDTREPSTGSAKGDTYLWALYFYLREGRCNPRSAGYYIDAAWLKEVKATSTPDSHTLTDHDYFISNRAFIFDLSPWNDEAPNDDPAQPVGTDRKVLQSILLELYRQTRGQAMIKIGGFPPWPFKYTTVTGGKHPPVNTEWEFVKVVTQYNAYVEADAPSLNAIANASFFRHFPLSQHITRPNPIPTYSDWDSKGYITTSGGVAPKVFIGFYLGDYDAPSWLYRELPIQFADSTRGQVPLNWAFDPNLADRVPQAMAYAYQNATGNDFFIAGDSGAGYVNPHALDVRPDSNLPSGLEAWTEHCIRYYRRFDMSITGFIIDGLAGETDSTEFAAYQRFSPNGIGTQFGPPEAIQNGVPRCLVRDLGATVADAETTIAGLANGSGGPVFLWLRSTLKNPHWYLQLMESLKTNHPNIPFETVDAYTYFGLLAIYLGAAKP